MVKRKISDYYAQRKRRSYGGSRKPSKITRKRNIRRRTTLRRTKRRVGSRSRRGYSKKGSRVKVTVGNLRTLTQQIIDKIKVGAPSGTAGTADVQGKRCNYYYPGVNQSSCYALGGLYHVINMADLIEKDEFSVSNASGQTVAETTYMVKDSFQDYDIVSCSNAAARMRIYHCYCKMDVINGESQSDIFAVLGDGFYQRGISNNRGGLNLGLTDPSITPFQSHKFCQYFTITKVENVILDPGAMISRRIVTGSYHVNMSHYTTQTTTNQTSLTATKDYSHRKGERFLLIQLEGQPANDSSSNLSYTSPSIDVDCKTSYTYQAMNRQAPILTELTALQYTVPNGLQIVEDETGAVIAPVNA